MTTLGERIVQLLQMNPGLSDRELTNRVAGPRPPQQPVNGACRKLAASGFLRRSPRADGRIGNYLTNRKLKPNAMLEKLPEEDRDTLTEDAVKLALNEQLVRDGWKTAVAWGKRPGIDIDARRGSERWIIEVKGRGSLSAMRVNYFLGILGETLQRMDDPAARYSIALPDLQQFRRLWERLPSLAKQRTGVTAIFVDEDGRITETDR